METTNEFQTTKIWKKTLRTLKQVAAATDSSIVETLDRLASQEWARIRVKEREEEMATTTVLSETLEKFIASDDFKSGVISSTKASWGGSGYSVELFPDGRWSVLWNSQIGNRYESPGKIFRLPALDTADMAEYVDGGAGSEDDFLSEAFDNEEDDLKAELRDQNNL